MTGIAKLMTPGGGGVSLTPASSIASDVTVNVPVTGVNNGTLVCSDSSGNVGIGTSTLNANARVQINGRTYMGANGSVYAAGVFYDNTRASAGQGYYIGATDSTAPSLILSNNDGTERMRIDSSGNLLVGTTSVLTTSTSFKNMTLNGSITVGPNLGAISPDATLNVKEFGGICASFFYGTTKVGSITSTSSATAYNTSSDYRLKENIQPMQNALATVAQLNPVTYNWKADGSEGQGFIAHELQAVVPDCVTGEKDAVDEDGNPVYQGIDTSFLVATLTKAIQELKEQVDAQAALIATQSEEIAQLKGAA